jgi:hypothetical protein
VTARIVIRVSFRQSTPGEVWITTPGVACHGHARVGVCGRDLISGSGRRRGMGVGMGRVVTTNKSNAGDGLLGWGV